MPDPTADHANPQRRLVAELALAAAQSAVDILQANPQIPDRDDALQRAIRARNLAAEALAERADAAAPAAAAPAPVIAPCSVPAAGDGVAAETAARCARRQKNPNPRGLHPVLFLEHAGRFIWRSPHDREPLWLDCWYRLDCFDYGAEFDVRALPGYIEFPRFVQPETDNKKWIEQFEAWIEAKQQHHANIIRAALDAGHEPVTVRPPYLRTDVMVWAASL
jgi:hypothetical protein